MFLSETRLKNYSRTERKLIEQHTTGDAYLRTFYPATPKEVLTFVCQREKSAGFYWCPQHSKWEEAAHACYPDFTPTDYRPEGGNSGGEDGSEGEQKQQEERAGEQQQDQKSESKEQSEMKLSDYKEVEWTDEQTKRQWTTDIKEHLPGHWRGEGETAHVIWVDKIDGTHGLFKVDPDGKVHYGGMEQIVGKLKQPQQQQDEKQQQPQEEEKKEQKRWLKFVLNRCPQCSTDTLQKIWQQPPAPENDEDRLDFTQTPCGCDALKDIFKTDEALVDDPEEWTGGPGNRCGAEHIGSAYICTKRRGHKGKHVARVGYGVTDILCAIDPW